MYTICFGSMVTGQGINEGLWYCFLKSISPAFRVVRYALLIWVKENHCKMLYFSDHYFSISVFSVSVGHPEYAQHTESQAWSPTSQTQ